MHCLTRRDSKWLIVAGLVMMAAWCGPAEGSIVYDNLGSSPYNAAGYGSFGLIGGVRYGRGMQFTASDTIELSMLELAIGQAGPPGPLGPLPGTAKVELLTDVGNQLGVVLESWTTATLSNRAGEVETLMSLLSPTLTAGTNYWILLSAASDSDLGGAWFFADAPQPGNVRVVVTNEDDQTSNYGTRTRGFRTRVSGTTPMSSVPEAGSLAIWGLLIGLGGLLNRGRRGRKYPLDPFSL